MAIERELVLNIAGKISKAFNDSIKLVNAQLSTMGSKTQTAAGEIETLQAVITKRKEVVEATDKYAKYAKKVEELQTKMKTASKITVSMQSNFDKAQRVADKYKDELNKVKNELGDLESQNKTAGLSVEELSKKYEQQNSILKKNVEAIEKASKTVNHGQDIMQSGKNLRMSGATSMLEGYAMLKTVQQPLNDAIDFDAQTKNLALYTDKAEALMKINMELSKQDDLSVGEYQKIQVSGITAGTVDPKNIQQIKDYSVAVANASDALNLSSDTVSNAFNQFNDQLTGDMYKTTQLFDTINSVSKAAQADAGSLISVMQNSATTVRSFTSLTNDQIVGLSAAFTKMSSSASAASTSQTLFIKSLTMGKGATKNQLEGWNALGINAEKLAQAMNGGPKSAQAAISAVLDALNKLPKAEKQATMSKIFGKNQELLATVDKLSSNKAGYYDLGMNTATSDNKGSVQKDADIADSSAEAQQKILANNMKALSIIIGQQLLPVWNDLLGKAIELGTMIVNLAQKFPTLTKSALYLFGVMAGGKIALGALTWVAGSLITCIGRGVVIFGRLKQVWLVANGVMSASSTCMRVSASVLKGLTALFRLNTYKVIASTVAHKVHNAVLLTGKGITTAYKAVVSALSVVFSLQTYKTIALTVAEKAKNAAMIVGSTVAKTAGAVMAVLANMTGLSTAKTWLYVTAQKAMSAAMIVGSTVAKTAGAVMAVLANMTGLSTAKTWLYVTAQKAMSAAMIVGSTVMKGLAAAGRILNIVLMANPIGLIIGLIGGLIAAGVWLYQNWDTVKEKAGQLWDWFAQKFPGIATVVQTVIGTAVNSFKTLISAVSSVWERVKAIFSNIIDFVSNVFTGNWSAAWENVKNIFGNVFGALVDLAKLPINSLINLINKAFSSIGSISVDIPDWVPGVGGKTYGFEMPQIPALATGGIATAPTLALIGEGKENEAVLPLSKLESMLSVSAQNAEYSARNEAVTNFSSQEAQNRYGYAPSAVMIPELDRSLGTTNNVSNSTVNSTYGGNSTKTSSIVVNFNPQITVNAGNGEKADPYAQVTKALTEGRNSLKRELEKLFSDRSRLTFS